MARCALMVADIFRTHGPAWRRFQPLSLGQLKVMSAIEQCRNWHCPKCQGQAAQRWLDARQADLLPVPYYHVVFTLPVPISAIAYYNKAVIYALLFDVPPRPCAPSRPTRSIWGRRSAPPWCCIPRDRH